MEKVYVTDTNLHLWLILGIEFVAWNILNELSGAQTFTAKS